MYSCLENPVWEGDGLNIIVINGHARGYEQRALF